MPIRRHNGSDGLTAELAPAKTLWHADPLEEILECVLGIWRDDGREAPSRRTRSGDDRHACLLFRFLLGARGAW
jgi:hypothetical protein